jgi:hypothetical protein
MACDCVSKEHVITVMISGDFVACRLSFVYSAEGQILAATSLKMGGGNSCDKIADNRGTD